MEEEVESPFKPHHESASEESAEKGERWIGWCAVVSAVLAVCAAVSGLYSGQLANTAVLEQIQASDQWSYYQAKGVKSAIAEMANNTEKVERYKQEQQDINEKATALAESSERHLQTHESLAASVTLFQIAIALTAISVLTRRRHFMAVVAGLAAAGSFFVLKALL